jgi:hypothetical protein
MATIDDELLREAEEDAREADYILSQLPSELKERFSRDEVTALLDDIADYFFESGLLESGSDEVEIDLDEVAEGVCRKAREERGAEYRADDVFFIVQADLDYQEQSA